MSMYLPLVKQAGWVSALFAFSAPLDSGGGHDHGRQAGRQANSHKQAGRQAHKQAGKQAGKQPWYVPEIDWLKWSFLYQPEF